MLNITETSYPLIKRLSLSDYMFSIFCLKLFNYLLKACQQHVTAFALKEVCTTKINIFMLTSVIRIIRHVIHCIVLFSNSVIDKPTPFEFKVL